MSLTLENLDYHAQALMISVLKDKIQNVKDNLIENQSEIETAMLRGKVYAFTELIAEINQAASKRPAKN